MLQCMIHLHVRLLHSYCKFEFKSKHPSSIQLEVSTFCSMYHRMGFPRRLCYAVRLFSILKPCILEDRRFLMDRLFRPDRIDPNVNLYPWRAARDSFKFFDFEIIL
jgi:hypothetical protein